MNETPITLTLQIHADGDHVAGEVSDHTGGTVPFTGRIGLICAIDAFVARETGDPDRPCRDIPHQARETA